MGEPIRAFRIRIPLADEEDASAALWDAGTLGFEVRPAPNRQASLDLLAYFPASTEPAVLTRLLPTAVIEPTEVPAVDWVTRFREGFRSFSAGRFRIVPVWEQEPPTAEWTLLVDPGRAFGTGTHETTRLCLGAIEDLAERRPLGRVLDLGAGTGILAIAAARLGASSVVASDIDVEAVESSRLHGRLNRETLRLVRADGGRAFRPRSFDFVAANLIGWLLVERAAEIRSLVAPGGALALSGLLLDDVPLVRDAFSACGAPRQRVDGEWAALVYQNVP